MLTHFTVYESGTTFALPAFAAHIYFRALSTIPSLIASWIQDCKDRSLSATVGTLTATHFSPVIIARELAHVRTADAAADLADENFVVKVAPAVHEVTAAYTVDEHQLEMKMKIPADWPLHKIEMRDVKTVGVDDRRWKSWMLAVQQVLWFQVRVDRWVRVSWGLMDVVERPHLGRSCAVQEERHVAF